MAKRALSIVGQDPAVAAVFSFFMEGRDASFYMRPSDGVLVPENDFRNAMTRFRLVCKNFNAVADQVVAANKEEAPFADYLSGKGPMSYTGLTHYIERGVMWPLETRVRLLRQRGFYDFVQYIDGVHIVDDYRRADIIATVLRCNFPGSLRRAEAVMRFWDTIGEFRFSPCGGGCKGYAGVFEDDVNNPPCECMFTQPIDTFARTVGETEKLHGGDLIHYAARWLLGSATSASEDAMISFYARIGAAKLAVKAASERDVPTFAVYVICMLGTPEVVRAACENKKLLDFIKKDRRIPRQLPCTSTYRGVGATVQAMTILADAGVDYAPLIDFNGCGTEPSAVTRSATYLHYMKLRDEQLAYVRANSS